ncbi:hypothetical protein FOA52_000192 [Chlamydomonas sp. UWO 241]|nr:hypothetical protein FOA52_000192 [Chlamydomonas sp. UWO 241]
MLLLRRAAAACSTSGRPHVSIHPPGPSSRQHPACSRGVRAHAAAVDDDTTGGGDGDDETASPGRPLRVERLLANLGYGKRQECAALVSKGRARHVDGRRLKVGEKITHDDLVLDGEALDPAFPLVVLLNKPVGYVVTSPEDTKISDPKVYDLLPFRFGQRRPFLSSVGRLDKATSGLLLLTDDGKLVQRINAPRRGIWKVYEATLTAPLVGKEADKAVEKFASGKLKLVGDTSPLMPARLEVVDAGGGLRVRVSVCEGRYHQVRRMFTAIGHEVVALHRASVGGLTLGDLPEAEYRLLSLEEVGAVFDGPGGDEVLGRRAAKQLPAASG